MRRVSPRQDGEALARTLADAAVGRFDDVQVVVNRPRHEVERTIARFLAGTGEGATTPCSSTSRVTV